MELLDRDVGPGGLVKCTFADEADGGRLIVDYQQDIEANVEHAKRLANDSQYSADGIKKGMWHVAHIPDVVIVELLGIGIDIWRAPAREIIAGLKRLHKDHLITTTKRV